MDIRRDSYKTKVIGSVQLFQLEFLDSEVFTQCHFFYYYVTSKQCYA